MPDPLETRPIPPRARAFLDAPRFAVVGTAGADGTPHQAVSWYRLDGDTLVLNSLEGRRWPTDLRRDRRVSVAVADGYDNVVVSGRVEVIDDQERAHADIAEMARRYHADDPELAEQEIARFQGERRVTFIVHPERVHLEFEEG